MLPDSAYFADLWHDGLAKDFVCCTVFRKAQPKSSRDSSIITFSWPAAIDLL